MGRTGRLYRKVRAGIVAEPTYFSWVEEGLVAASGLPSSEKQVRWLAEHGIRTILTLTEYPLPEEWLRRNRISGKHLPIGDHRPPNTGDLRDAAAFIEREVREGRPVAVHCLAGKGRTGTILAAYLAHSREMGIDEAIRYVRRIRPGSIEASQETLLHQYARLLGNPGEDEE